MHAPTHRKAAAARDLRIERAKRLANERSRRSAAAMARVHAAGEDARTTRLMRAIFGVDEQGRQPQDQP